MGWGPGNLGGKYYSEGEYESEHDPDYYWGAIAEVVVLRDQRKLPGLVEGHSDYHVLIMTEPEPVPHLLVCPSFVNPATDS